MSVIVTGHDEGEECRATFAALALGVEVAAQAGLAVEVLGTLDRADEETSAAFDNALGEDGVVGRLATGRVVATDHGDPGAARNEGVRLARGAWVCLLDADNLPSRSWLRDAYAVAAAHGAPCVVHPERLVIFGERWEVWPQLPTDHPGFRAHNFFDRTYWDTFCLAAREVLEQHPYAATSAADGLGPEDWHWGMETVHAGIPHLVAPDTSLFYRAKASGSVQGSARRFTQPPPAGGPAHRRHARQHAAAGRGPGGRRWRCWRTAILRDHRGERVRAAVPEPAPGGWRRRRRRLAAMRDRGFNVLHYKALNAEPLRLPDGEAVEHFLDVGRSARLRTVLSEVEPRPWLPGPAGLTAKASTRTWPPWTPTLSCTTTSHTAAARAGPAPGRRRSASRPSPSCSARPCARKPT